MEAQEFFTSNWFFFILFVVIVNIAAQWRVYEKAGKPGWAAIIPIYNILILLEIIGKPWWWLLLMLFVPGVNIVLGIWATNLLSKCFGQNVGFTIGLILFSVIFYPILAFGNFEYKGIAGQ